MSCKNEAGKDLEMIEMYVQESLKSLYITVVEYLENVPQVQPMHQEEDQMQG